MVEERLASHGGQPLIDAQRAHFIWPRVTQQVVDTVVAQLYDTISIYDNGGVFGEFERAFSSMHGRSFGLLSNSGTSSILAMFEAIGLEPGDEVLCPVYTFHASVSPLAYLGVKPIFCDSDEQGNICLEAIQQRRTTRTKAVIITHMWGVPARDSAAIASYCRRENLRLLEDCSHAHGAVIGGRQVGTFGDAAAWSLQGQKIVTGGEGGILLTDDRALYERALLHGHYNKRPKTEIEPGNPLRDYYLTGMGLKLRAHPLAIAIALQQLGQLEKFISTKQRFAERFMEAIDGFPFLGSPPDGPEQQNAWYAFNMAFREDRAFGVTRQEFADALIAEGLVEVDIPGSTGLVDKLPLFTRPGQLLPRATLAAADQGGQFPRAQAFYESIIKLPVWAYEDDEAIVAAYASGIRKVANYLARNQTLAEK